MDTPSSAGVPRRWRDAKPAASPPAPAHRRARPRGILALFAVTAMALILVAIGAMLSWLRPVARPYLLPIMVSGYDINTLPAPPMVGLGRNSLCTPTYFRIGEMPTRLQAHVILRELANLAKMGNEESAVVYISAHALLGEAGQVFLLPADAKPDKTGTWIGLRDVLKSLKACPARHQLLVLDIATPGRFPFFGNLHGDLAGSLEAELQAEPDSRRLVLSACANGQVSLVSEELGRSVFSYYFEEGLRGYADGYDSDGERDRRITVRELAAFVRARVDRWAQRNRAVRQTPILHGTGADFALRVLERDEPRDHVALALPRPYPDYLSKAWQARDACWQEAMYRFEPGAFARMQASLLAAENAWRGGTLDSSKQARAALLESTQGRMARQRALFQPRPASLAQEQVTNPQAAETVTKAVRDLMDGLHTRLAQAPPEEGEKLKATARAAFQYTVKDQPSTVLEAAVFAWAVADSKHEPGTLRFLDDVLRRRAQPEPHFVETLLLRQLADLTYRIAAKDWPAPLVGRLLRLAELGEKANADAGAFPWTAHLLMEAAQARHQAEVSLWARGYAALSDVERFAESAEDAYKTALAQAGLIHHAQATLEQALALLPFYVPNLETDAEHLETWEQAVDAARKLAGALANPPAWKKSKAATSVSAIQQNLAALQAVSQALAGSLEKLNRPFTKETVNELANRTDHAAADPALVAKAEAILSVPAPTLVAADRATLWALARRVARSLNQEAMRLDQEDDRLHSVTAGPEPIRIDYALQDESAHARRRAGNLLALLELAGMTRAETQPMRDTLARLATDGSAPRNWIKLENQLREAAAQAMARRHEQERSPGARVQLEWLMAPLNPLASEEDAPIAAASLVRLRQERDHWTWLSDHYRYQARDYQGLGLPGAGPMAAQAFYAGAAAANEDIARHEPEVYATIRTTRPVGTLASPRLPVRATLEINRVMPPGQFGSLDVSLALADRSWLQVSPNAVHLLDVPEAAESRQIVSKIAVEIGQLPGAALSTKPRPAGFIAIARFEGRTYHTLVDVPLEAVSKDVQIVVSADPARAEPALTEIRLRPNQTAQPFYVYLRNLSERVRNVTFMAQMGDGPLHKVQVDLNPEETKRVRFSEAPIPTGGLPEAAGNLLFRALDAHTTNLLDQKQLRVEVDYPTLYVRVGDLRYEPLSSGGSGKLSVNVQAAKPVSGPKVRAELVLDAKRLRGYAGAGGGTFQGELVSGETAPPLTLFADKIRLTEGGSGQGPVFVTVDGMERAFQFKATLTRQGAALTFPADTRPTVRWQVAPFVKAAADIAFPIEVDNAPAGSSLEVSLGRGTPDRFEPELTSRFANGKQHRFGFLAQGKDGALTFDARVNDWHIAWNTRYVVGQRLLRARLLDAQSKEIIRASQYVTIDNDPPALARLIDLPAKLPRAPLKMKAQAMDPESGIAQVVFFVGRPYNDRIPANLPTIAATPMDASKNIWSADIPLPKDKTGPTPITAQFTNGVGLVTYRTASLELTDSEPSERLGRIRGKVLEGSRVQPGLEVTLRNGRGMEVRRTKTKSDGSYVFEGVEPGSYVINCVKPDSGRSARSPATIGPSETSTHDLTLSL